MFGGSICQAAAWLMGVWCAQAVCSVVGVGLVNVQNASVWVRFRWGVVGVGVVLEVVWWGW